MMTSQSLKYILNSGKLSREKTSANWWKTEFLQRILSQISHFCRQRIPHPQILWRNPSQLVKSLIVPIAVHFEKVQWLIFGS